MNMNIGSRSKRRLSKAAAFLMMLVLLAPPAGTIFAEVQISQPQSSSSDVSNPDSVSVEGSMDSSAPSVEKKTGLSGDVLESADSESISLDPSGGDPVPMSLGIIHGGTDANTAPPGATDGAQKTIPAIDQTTGALTYAYSFSVPPGREGLTPEVSLSYNSQQLQKGSVAGYGWSLSIPYITRVNKHGTNKLYTKTYQDFVSSVSGELVQLTQPNPLDLDEGAYAPKSDTGDFLKYSYVGGVWTVLDKTGVVYSYGATAASRQDDPANASRVFTWMLSEVRSSNDNFISYSYYKDQGQIYPSSINYTGHAMTPGIYTVNFNRISTVNPYTGYATGFKVQTAYTISSVAILVGGVLTHSYALTYAPSTTIVTRYLLLSIQESSVVAGVTTTLPATSFSYQAESAKGFDYGLSSTSVPIITQKGVVSSDVNGDSYPDLVRAYRWTMAPSYSYNDAYTYRPNTGSWVLDTTRPVPSGINYYAESSSGAFDGGTKTMDVNGDLKPDLIKSNRYDLVTPYEGEINTGSGWSSSTAWNPNQFGYTVADLNGDGLPDYIEDGRSYGVVVNTTISLDNGAGFDRFINPTHHFGTPLSDYDTPELLRDQVLVDVNGDGLADIVKSTQTSVYSPPTTTFDQKVYINTGTGWVLDPSWTLPSGVPFFVNSGSMAQPQSVYFIDINHDGFADIVVPYVLVIGGSPITNMAAYINTGHSWVSDTGWYSLAQLNNNGCGCQSISLVDDFNADGSPDIMMSVSGGGSSVNTSSYTNKNTNEVDLLSTITVPTGSVTTVSYKSSSQYVDTAGNLLNPNLPLMVETVSKISTTEPVTGAPASVTNFTYAGGSYYYNGPFDRKFAGFNIVTATDPLGNVTKTYYHEGDATDSAKGEYADMSSKIGRTYRVEEYDGSGNLYRLTVNKWDNFHIGTGRDFAKLARTTVLDYDGNSTHRDTAVEYTYDNANGNLLSKTNWGEVTAVTDGSFTDIGTDKSVETLTYAVPATGWAVGFMNRDTIADQTGTLVSDAKIYYDGLAYGSVSLGNVTQESKLKTGTTYVSSTKTYNAYGFVTSSTDENTHTTTYVPDSNNMYPSSATNALGHSTSYVYDYSNGKVSQRTDPNSFVYTTVYDGFGRILSESAPDSFGTHAPVLKVSYVYTDVFGASSIHRTEQLDASVSVDSYQYLDGRGRAIQSRVETETSGSYAVTDTVYDARGLASKMSLPYLSSGVARTVPTTTVALYSTTTYDALGRPVSVNDAVGTTAYVYDQWKTTVTDPNTHVKAYYKDAYGNLTQVDEVNGVFTYSTAYLWSVGGKLVKITDALGNIRNFQYDNLGHRIFAEDLHAVADTTYGTWSYQYDPVGNMTQSTSPNGAIVSYVYDAINRSVSEDHAGHAGIEVSYIYDVCANGTGKRCSVVMLSGANTTYLYDATGAVASETKTIGTKSYTTQYQYDRQGNTTSMTYPDGLVVQYVYNTAGKMEKVQRMVAGSPSDVVSNFDYAPTGAIATIYYANGVTTTNTYDAAHVYRLVAKTSINGSSTHLQDITYGYDAVGNIISLVDASSSDGSKTVSYTYDALNRLTAATATGVASGTSPYAETYTYDAIGNMLSGPAGSYTYAGSIGTNYANPHAYTLLAGHAATYDRDGNLLSDGTLTNTWNYTGTLATTVAGTSVSTYSYDHAGSRVSLDDGTLTTYYPTKYYSETSAGALTDDIYAGTQLVATIETPAVVPPIAVSTIAAGSITSSTVTFNGNLTALGGSPSATVGFDYGLTIAYGSSSPMSVLSLPGSFSQTVTGLACATTYHFRATALGTSGSAAGSDLTVTTLACAVVPPTVLTVSASSVSPSSETLNGSLTSLGSSTSTTVSFEYSIGTGYGSVSGTSVLTATGGYSQTITGLACGTSYNYRAKGVASSGTVYGAGLAFTTAACPTAPPAVSTTGSWAVTMTSAVLLGNLASLGTSTSAVIGFEYGTTTSYGSYSATSTATTTGAYSKNITGLTCATTYHFRAVASSISGSVVGIDMTLTTSACPVIPPTVVTAPASTIGMYSATLVGNLTSLGTSTSTVVGFEYGTSTSYGTYSVATTLTAPGFYSKSIASLACGTLYHFRATASSTSGTAVGSDATFTTNACPPGLATVVTDPATAVLLTTATLNGTLSSLGGASSVDEYFEYGLTTSYGSATATTTVTTTGSYSAPLTGLACGTTYNYRATATNVAGTAYGANTSFTTATCLTAPTVVTDPATLVTMTGATLNGTLTSLGGDPSATVEFDYSTDLSFSLVATATPMTSTGPFSAVLTGLPCGTLYNFKAHAANTTGGVDGVVLTFTTVTCPLDVVTVASAGISKTAATLYGNVTSLGIDPSATVSFDYGTTTSYGSTSSVATVSAPGMYSAALSGLTCGTTYHFRATAVAISGVSTGADMTFSTVSCEVVWVGPWLGEISVVSSASSVTGTLVDPHDNPTVVPVVAYGTDVTFATQVPSAVTMTGPGTFNIDLESPLLCGTTYYLRAGGITTGDVLTYGPPSLYSYACESSGGTPPPSGMPMLVPTPPAPPVPVGPQIYYVHADHVLGSNVITDSTGSQVELLDYLPYGSMRFDLKVGGFSEAKKFGGHLYDADTGLNYLGARYLNTSVGRFISEDPSFLALGDAGRTQAMTGQDMNSVLSDPQSLNSYAYARNNPINKIDPDGRWYKELLTGNQSWSSFMGEVGEATQYMGSGWQTAMDHPYAAGAAVGVAGGLAAYGAAAAMTQINVGINLANLDQLPMESRVDTMANKGFDAIQKATGLAKGDAVNLVKSGGESLVDLRNGGNINNIANYGEKAIRITTTPDASKIISSGIMNASKIPGYISSGAMQALPFLSSVAKSAAQFIGK